MRSVVDLVIKVGGNLARDPHLARCLRPLGELRARHRVLIVPGGGAFADLVRAESARHGLPESTGHWMGVLAMEQYGHLLAGLLPGSVLARTPEEIAAALDEGKLPVLAPYRWLREEDPLPHSWAVTSDSIAAWAAGRLGAGRLILVKRREGETAVDGYFETALPEGLEWEVVVPEGGGWRPAGRGAPGAGG